MDTAVPTTPDANPASGYSPYVWQDADSDAVTPTQAMDGGPQVSQPSGEIDGLTGKPFGPAKVETPRAATVRRVATAAAGVGLVAAAVLTARGLRGDNAKAGANVIDYDD